MQVSAILLVGSLVLIFWSSFCDAGLKHCLNQKDPLSHIEFVLLATFRPFLLTPTIVLTTIGGNAFHSITAVFLTCLGATLSTALVFIPGKFVGIYGARPWLSSNLPATWQMLKTQDYKVVFFLRWISIFPHDVGSFLFGLASFNLKRTLIASFVGHLPEAILFTYLAKTDTEFTLLGVFLALFGFGFVTLLPLLILEFLSRKGGSNLWTQLKRTWYEILFEIRSNNEIIRRRDFSPDTTPVILLYGFFSSRKALTIMERLLTQRGFQVMSFNLGGLLGVFFTRGIKETAEHIKLKIDTQLKRHSFKNVHIVAHSKGGLVALWWLLKLGGANYCDKVITMGTPFRGTYLTYLGLISPVGMFWRDLWQMRPHSQFLTELHTTPIPKHVRITCLFSNKDRIVGASARFQPDFESPQVTGIAMHHVSHFEFLYRRDVADRIARILREAPPKATLLFPETRDETQKAFNDP